MSLITRCPSCQTLFKVVPDQLRVSQGWVRCGQCEEIFDAAQHLQESDSEAGLVSPAAQSSEDVAASAEAFVTVRARVAAEPPPDLELPFQETSLAEVTPADEGDEHVLEPETSSAVDEPDLDLPLQEEAEPEPLMMWRADGGDVAVMQPSFLGAASSVRQGALGLWIWRLSQALLIILLLGALLIQIARVERDTWAQRWPVSREWLELLCKGLACRVEPLRDPDSLVIESSSFTRVVGDVYRLGLTLHNRSAKPLAWPAIELTLTDAGDQPVLRRALHPTEWGMPGATLDAAREWRGQMSIRVRLPAGAERFVGYRLYVFYP